MPSRLLILTVFAVSAGMAAAQTALEPLVSRIRTQPLSLPAETVLVTLSPADKTHPRETYTIKRQFSPDGTFTSSWQSSRFQSLQSFRPDGTIAASRQVDLTKEVTLESQTDPQRTTVRTVITEKGKIKSEKVTTLKPDILLREEMQNIILQAWLSGVRDGLKFQSLSPDGGLAVDFQIVFKATADPTTLSDKYSYPQEFRAVLAQRNAYVVADLGLLGIGALFYPHRFYLVYLSTPSGLEFVAYFGEDPKNPTFQYVKKE